VTIERDAFDDGELVLRLVRLKLGVVVGEAQRRRAGAGSENDIPLKAKDSMRKCTFS